MFEGLSDKAKQQLRFRIYDGIMLELSKDNITLNEKEEMVKWYSDNIITCANDLVKKLDEVKEVNK